MEMLERLQLPQAVLAGVVLTVIYYFLLFDSGQGISMQISKAQKEYKEKTLIKGKIKQALEDKKRFEAEAEEINRNLEAFLRYFPAESSQNKLMKDISTAAESQQLVVLSLKPIKQAPEFPNYPETAFEFEVQGTYVQVMSFISELTQLKRAIDFRGTELKIVDQGDNPMLSFKANLIVFGRKARDKK